MSFPKGTHPPMKETPCTRGCGTILLRYNHLLDAICKPCQDKEESSKQVERIRQQRIESRRYRTLLAVSGYTYEALLESVRFRRIAQARRTG